jgi:hypothetical protein
LCPGKFSLAAQFPKIPDFAWLHPGYNGARSAPYEIFVSFVRFVVIFVFLGCGSAALSSL